MARLLQPQQVQPSGEELRYAEPYVIDFDWLKADCDENRKQQLSSTLLRAKSTGLLHVVNHGLDPNLFKVLRAVTHTYMMEASIQDKDEAVAVEGTGCFEGYKPRTDDEKRRGILPVVEEYNYDYRHGQSQSRPMVIRENECSTRKIFDFYHKELTPRLLNAIDDFLGFPPGTLNRMHSSSSEVAHLLFYRPKWYQNIVKKKASYAGHTDIGSLTYLYANPIASLQVYGPRGWEYVSYIPNSIVVNMGDAMHFLSRGQINATLHRVIKPRSEHDDVARTALVYFVHPNHDNMSASLAYFQQLRIKYTNETRTSPGSPVDASGLDRIISSVSALNDDTYLSPVDGEAWKASRMGGLVSSPRDFHVDYEKLLITSVSI